MPKYSAKNPRRGGILQALLVIAVLVIAAITIAIIVIGNSFKVKERGTDRVSIETPAGTVKIQGHKKLDPESLGIPVYPGAVLAEKNSGGGASFEWDSKRSGESSSVTIAGAEYTTDDSAEKVLEFYRKKLGTWIFVDKAGDEAKFEQTEGNWKRIVGITHKNGATHIGIASIGEPARN